jgi:putative proteasome-type protease
MTYCLAMRLNEGLLFLSDTRTNAGVDNVGTYRKLHVFEPAPDRLFVLQSAGNLATTQEVLDRIELDLAAPGEHESLLTVEHLFEAALYVGRLSQEVAASHRSALNTVGADGTATFIVGGQISGGEADIMLVYPEGNYIRASDDRPFLQIGESKYGKFLLELAVRTHVDIDTALKVALGSMLSTSRANLSVGPPYDAGVCRNDTFSIDEYRFSADSAILADLEEVWARHLLNAVREFPRLSLSDLRLELPNEPRSSES